MLKFILMLLGLAFGQNNANTSGNNNSNDNGKSTIQLADPATVTDPRNLEGETGGETTQTPPKK
ncbi:hypothetical protein [Chryseobacterium mucoviscidosis]|uniref:hypothetical protein n=1 Tax=Chryseobacterium mucoviscidosis TaxID=1945581 RepID=UPI0031D36E72